MIDLATFSQSNFFTISFDFSPIFEHNSSFCNNSMIGTTKLRQSEFKNKVNSLSSLVNTTESQIMKNQKLILQNTKNNIALKAVSDPNADEDTSDACKQYPIAC